MKYGTVLVNVHWGNRYKHESNKSYNWMEQVRNIILRRLYQLGHVMTMNEEWVPKEALKDI
jgi:hypothetical protein